VIFITIEGEVDSLLNLHSSCKKKTVDQPSRFKRWYWIILGLICFSIGTVLLLPMVDKRWIESFFGAEEQTLDISAEETNVSIPFHYWYAPEKSFGISNMTTINATFWRNWANNTIEWYLEQSVNGNTWNDCTDLLTVTTIWDAYNISYKYTLNFTTNSKQYYRIIKRTNLSSNLKTFQNINNSNRFLLNYRGDQRLVHHHIPEVF